jgi:hypothetical protein
VLGAIAIALALSATSVVSDLRGQAKAEERTAAEIRGLHVKIDTNRLIVELQTASLRALAEERATSIAPGL